MASFPLPKLQGSEYVATRAFLLPGDDEGRRKALRRFDWDELISVRVEPGWAYLGMDGDQFITSRPEWAGVPKDTPPDYMLWTVIRKLL